ncbi:MAG: hypothetical protein II442_01700, partial [Oscillospiraceae bacterium]|nr:hypothetical protein [Oscillospiraceae bacterium]
MAGVIPLRRRELMDENRIMNAERLNEATQLLLKYQAAKSSVNERIVNAQQWWKLKNWEEIRKNRGVRGATAKPTNTGWLWNCIVGKHADAIDSFPEPVILPRMEDDKAEAQQLSKIVPVVMEMNDFEQTYNDCSWQKMQEGTGVYGIFWNSRKLNGLGDIDIKKVNMLYLFWEPGISDIQDSRNVFYISYENKKDLEMAYPELQGKLNTTKLSIKEYKTDDSVDHSDEAVVVDWYYKKTENGVTALHYCKYVNETCLYSSEEEGLTEGYYADGEYPFVLDSLFPVEGSPAGYGYIDIGKDTQTDIDTLSQAMVKNAVVRATPRYFVRKDGSVNEEEFTDASKPLVHVGGSLGEDALRAVETQAMGTDAHNMLQQLIDALKFITGNTDVNNGGVPSGVTAASAIAALKEDSGRSSKDSTKAAYRAYRKIVLMVIERIRQFYDIPRQFRILGADGAEEFVQYSNENLQVQQIPNLPGMEPGLRMPIFDIEVRAQRENAYTKMSQNELALQFYDKGLLAPQMADQALIVLDMMDFRGKEELRKKIQAQGTLMDTMMQVGQIAMQLAQEYRPEIAEQLGMVIQGAAADAGMSMPNGGGGAMQGITAPADEMSAPNPNENSIVRRAKEQAANASRPN